MYLPSGMRGGFVAGTVRGRPEPPVSGAPAPLVFRQSSKADRHKNVKRPLPFDLPGFDFAVHLVGNRLLVFAREAAEHNRCPERSAPRKSESDGFQDGLIDHLTTLANGARTASMAASPSGEVLAGRFARN